MITRVDRIDEPSALQSFSPSVLAKKYSNAKNREHPDDRKFHEYKVDLEERHSLDLEKGSNKSDSGSVPVAASQRSPAPQRWNVLKGVAAGLGKKPRLVVLANAMTEDRVPSRRLETPQLG